MSLSGDGRFLAVGGPQDNYGTGATWIFEFNGTMYIQLGYKLVGADASGSSLQGKGMYVSC